MKFDIKIETTQTFLDESYIMNLSKAGLQEKPTTQVIQTGKIQKQNAI